MIRILYTFIILTIIGEIICGFWNLLKTFISIKKIVNDKVYKDNKIKTKSKIIVVIPCLREQSIIKETMDYFLKIITPYDNIELVIVTTEKEKYEQSLINSKELLAYKTTSEIVNDYIRKNNFKKIKHFHYPKREGMMSDQLNYVIKKYKNEISEETYFSIYNADSRPNPDTISSVLQMIEKEKFPYVIQQYSYAFSNINKLSFIMKGFALYQSNFEIKYGLVNSLVFPNLLYTYVVGHGLYIRFDILKKIGGFDNNFWCEDIFLSSILRNKNIKITPVLTLENMETPKKLSILIRQNANWFKTANQCIQMIRENIKKEKGLSFSAILWFLQRISMNFSWLFLPFLVVFSSAFCIYNHNVFLLIIMIFSYLFMQISNYFSTFAIIEKIENKKIKNKFLLLCAACISTLISNVGPIYSLINPKMKKYKTER